MMGLLGRRCISEGVILRYRCSHNWLGVLLIVLLLLLVLQFWLPLRVKRRNRPRKRLLLLLFLKSRMSSLFPLPDSRFLSQRSRRQKLRM